MNKKGTIILDFLMFVITTTVIAVSIITYLNIKEIKNSYSRELKTTLSNIVFIIDKCSENIELTDKESFNTLAKKLMESNGEKMYSIALYEIKGENELEEFFSTDETEHEKKIEYKNIKKIIEKDKEVAQQIMINKIPIYDYMKLRDENTVINIRVSLQGAVKHFKDAFIINVVVAVLAIIFMVGFTTYILLNKIYKPIQNLREEIKKIQDGEVSYQVKIGVKNELSELANEINIMKDSLWEKSFTDKFSHPVTGLPGLITEIEMVTDMIDRDEHFGILNITIKNFEKYVVRTGLIRGEDYLRNLYNMIEETVKEKKITGCKMFQIRENSISLITTSEEAYELGKTIIEKFDSEFISAYESVSIENGVNSQTNIKIKNIKGEEIEYPCTRIIITVIKNSVKGAIETYRDIENKILEIETLYNGVDDKSYCIVSGEKNEDKFNEENKTAGAENSNSILDGLDDL